MFTIDRCNQLLSNTFPKKHDFDVVAVTNPQEKPSLRYSETYVMCPISLSSCKPLHPPRQQSSLKATLLRQSRDAKIRSGEALNPILCVTVSTCTVSPVLNASTASQNSRSTSSRKVPRCPRTDALNVLRQGRCAHPRPFHSRSDPRRSSRSQTGDDGRIARSLQDQAIGIMSRGDRR